MALHLSSDLIVALEIIADNCVNSWQALMGNSNSQVAKK